MLTETLLRIPFAVIGRPLIGRENVQELTCHRRLPVSIFNFKIAV
jgi:hypothetical protein